jgi:hypothetical protein
VVSGNGAEGWRCALAGSSIYGFNIYVTRFGMSMTGDVGSLVLQIDSSYGINIMCQLVDIDVRILRSNHHRLKRYRNSFPCLRP